VDWLTVDSAKCNADGHCVAECPVGIIVMGQDLIPKAIDDAEARCTNCGHCVAVCPTGALTRGATTPDACPPVKRASLPRLDQVESFLLARRSIRAYQDTPVGRDVLAELIDVARYAPSGGNRQPVGWQIVYDRVNVRRLAELTVDHFRHQLATATNTRQADMVVSLWEKGIDVITRGAPHLIVVHTRANSNSATECALALDYLDLAAHARGLGTCHIGFMRGAAQSWAPLQEAMDLPEGRACSGVMVIGYPEHDFHRIPPRKPAQIIWR
jgi:nitroreductase/NAD-dependent dihydropyrimidine dehydrogenase PreA subunit